MNFDEIAALRDRSEAQEVLVNRRRRWWSARNDKYIAHNQRLPNCCWVQMIPAYCAGGL